MLQGEYTLSFGLYSGMEIKVLVFEKIMSGIWDPENSFSEKL